MTERDHIEELHQKYLSLRENTPWKKRDGEECKAYHEWYDAAYVYFKSFDYLQDNPDFNVFVNAEKNGNCFVLEHVYDSISPSYKVLMQKAENMQKTDNGETIAKTPMVFISHSSADTDIILSFIQNVLVLGLGLDKGDIVFTSDETYGINPGDDIPQYIKRNISGARVVLIMVSQGYKKSEVCLNEMGAAWALDRNIISVLMPDANFDQLGWVINLKKAVRLDKKKSLLSLTNQIAKLISVDMTDRFTDAVTGIDDFLDSINKADTPKNTDYQTTASSNVSVNTQPPISYNGESPERVLNDAINKLGEFTIKQLQDETGFKDYHYIAENVHSMVLSGALEEIGSKSHRKYRQVVTSHPLF